jgi:hypothetical protein
VICLVLYFGLVSSCALFGLDSPVAIYVWFLKRCIWFGFQLCFIRLGFHFCCRVCLVSVLCCIWFGFQLCFIWVGYPCVLPGFLGLFDAGRMVHIASS